MNRLLFLKVKSDDDEFRGFIPRTTEWVVSKRFVLQFKLLPI